MGGVVDEFLKNLKITGSVSVLHKPGSVRLDAFPKLVYAPSHWGPGVRTEDNGTLVSDIAVAFVECSGNVGAVAEKFATKEEHVIDAMKYAEKVGFLTGEGD